MKSGTTTLAVFEPLPQWADFLILAGVFMLVAIGALVWIVVFRKKKKRKHRRHQHEQRKFNPTLAESGGLPSVREEKKSGPPPP
jgi:hypothetical protein